jgi:glutamate carboxypeptidase
VPASPSDGDVGLSDLSPEHLLSLLAGRLPAYLSELDELCAIDCPTSDKSGVDTAGEWVKSWAEARGWDVQVWPDVLVGDSLGISGKARAPSGRRLLLAAHLDTVYPVGTVASRPTHRYGDRLLAPGAADNKSGLLSALHAMAALEDLGLTRAMEGVMLFCGGDEETDMRASAASLAELRPEFDAAFVLEAARENGDVVVARKGRGQFILEVTGKAAHAGVEPHRGANAIVALAQQIVAVQLLNGFRPGVTVNVGVVSGGTESNVVPAGATAEIDVRITSPDDSQAVDSALQAIARTTYVPNTLSQIRGGWVAPPMPRTGDGEKLATLAAACARELGFTLSAAETGGMSYANRLSNLGLPVLDGLGPIGGRDHSPDEYVLISSIVPRTAMLALLVLRWFQTFAAAGRES